MGAQESIPDRAAADERQTKSVRKRRPKWLKFSLLSLLVLMLVASVYLADYGRKYRAWLEEKERIVPTGFDLASGKNILWSANVGSQSYAGPTVGDGKVFVGTNNGAGYLQRYPPDVDLGVLLCFDAADGDFLWQASSEKLKAGRTMDWPLQGICSTPFVQRNRLWYVTSRCEVVCLDTAGFLDEEDDGERDPAETRFMPGEADVVWRFDMTKELGVQPEHMCGSSVCVAEGKVFAVTGHGASAKTAAPSFIALDKRNGKLVWSDDSPGSNVLHGQWASPTYCVVRGRSQVLFPGGDGWLYSFSPAGGPEGKGKQLWRFDCNPKDSEWVLGGRGTRNHVMNAPTVYNDRVYVAVGQNPEHGEGEGHLWCIDPTKRGDISGEMVVDTNDGKPVAHRRIKAFDPDSDEEIVPNPNSGVIWHFRSGDHNNDGSVDFEEEMHRTLSRVIVKDGLAFAADFSGMLHCLDAGTGKWFWSHDLFAACWSTPAVSTDHVFIGDEDGELIALAVSSDPTIALPGKLPASTSSAPDSIYATPVIDKNVMYILSRSKLIAVKDPKAK